MYKVSEENLQKILKSLNSIEKSIVKKDDKDNQSSLKKIKELKLIVNFYLDEEKNNS